MTKTKTLVECATFYPNLAGTLMYNRFSWPYLATLLLQLVHDKAKLATVIMKFLDVSMKMKAANSKDCQRLLLCQLNGQVSGQSLNNWHLSQVCSLGLAKMVSGLMKTTAVADAVHSAAAASRMKQAYLNEP